jgi:hypothetical protein
VIKNQNMSAPNDVFLEASLGHNVPHDEIAQHVVASFNKISVDIREDVRDTCDMRIASHVRFAAKVFGAAPLPLLDKALVRAINSGVDIDTIQRLIELGAHINLKCDGKRLTYVAAVNDRADVLKLLLDRNAKFDATIFDMDVTYAVACVLCKHVIASNVADGATVAGAIAIKVVDSLQDTDLRAWTRRVQPIDAMPGDYLDLYYAGDWHSVRVSKRTGVDLKLYMFDLKTTVTLQNSSQNLALAGSRATQCFDTELGQLVSIRSESLSDNRYVPAIVTADMLARIGSAGVRPYGFEGVDGNDDSAEMA